MTTPLNDLLEPLLDESDLQTVIEALSAVCFEKAAHLESNWQDRVSAKYWRSAGRYLEQVSANSKIRAVRR